MARRSVKKLNKKSFLDGIETIPEKHHIIIEEYIDGEVVRRGQIVTIDGKEYAEYSDKGEIERELL